jgi:hypothetical protein
VKLTPDRIALFGAVLVVLAGYLVIVRPSEAAIGERYAQIDADRTLLERERASTGHAAALAAEDRMLARWIARSGIDDDRTTLVDRLLGILAAAARHDAVRITAVTAEPSLPAAASAEFNQIPLRVSLRGSYPNVLAFTRTVIASGIAAHVGIDEVTNADRPSAHAPELRATLYVALLQRATVTHAAG